MQQDPRPIGMMPGRRKGVLALRPDRFTTLAQQSLADAQSLASRRRHPELVGLHLLSALLEDRSGPVASVLPRVGADVDRIAKVVASELEKLPTVDGGQPSGGVYGAVGGGLGGSLVGVGGSRAASPGYGGYGSSWPGYGAQSSRADRESTRLNSSHPSRYRMPPSA